MHVFSLASNNNNIAFIQGLKALNVKIRKNWPCVTVVNIVSPDHVCADGAAEGFPENLHMLVGSYECFEPLNLSHELLNS